MPLRRRLLNAGLLATAVTAAGAMAAEEAGRVAADQVGARELRYEVAGLEQPAEILIDAWGVPHIYAGTHYDAFFVQGFNAARDRLWQIDTWRRRGLGTLSEVLGAGYVAQDRAARLFLYRGDMYREWLAYGSDAKRIAEAFTAGINAYVRLVDQQPALLPPEFELLGYKPSLWSAEDVVRIRSHGLWRNVTSEVRRARIACRHGLDAAQLWKVLEPAWSPRIPDGLDPCSIPDRVLDDYLLAKAPVTFDAEAMRARGRSDGNDLAQIARVEADDLARELGSNNWVVAPGRTDTGRPILANDPHRSHAVPSLRYVAHLSAPGLDVIGAGEPALPGISIGHNGQIAFGLTIFPIDQEDLYVYDRVADGYRYQARVEPLQTVTETIAVKGEAPRTIELQFTRHGPVVYRTDNRLFAVRAGWLEQPGMAPYFGSVEYMRAQNWREFVGALNRWGAPSENQVYADVDGHIGYKPAGLFPRRRTWDGLLPVPGNGRYEWDGYFDMDALPVEYDPARGFSATANALTLPPDYPIAERRVGFEWTAPWRQRRVFEVLGEQQAHSVEQSLALQRDYHSILAREVLTLLPAKADGTAGTALAMLRAWDHDLDPDSAAAALFAVWFYRHLPPALAAALLPEGPEDLLPLDSLTILDTLRYPVGQTVALDALAEAMTALKAELGDDPAAWRWGELHQIRFRHPLLAAAPDALAESMRLPPYPRGGSANTANNTSFDPANLLVASGASFRMVLDVGNWDAARMTNAPGQSGDPRSPFYANLLEGWARDGSFPLWYSREAVEQHRVQTITLAPASDPAIMSPITR
ncbi:MAG: penicillin acylase family protein [Pseudomonadales bacterium]